jgi:hypothetical protein
VSGWERPTPPGDEPARTFWAQEPQRDALGPGQLIRGSLALYRATPRRFLVVAAVPELIRDLLAIPSFVIAFGFIEGLVSAFGDYLARTEANPAAFRADPWSFRAEFQDQIRAVLVPPPDLASLSAATGAVGVAVGLLGSSALTAMALAAARTQPITATESFRLVLARAALLKPIIALGIGWLAAAWLPPLLQTSPEFQAWAGAPGSPRSVLLGSLLSVFGVVIAVLIVVVAVRWALYMATVVAESVGVGAALARSAELSRGIRSRLALAMVGILLLHAISVGLVAAVVGITMGASTASVTIGFGAYLVTSLVGNLLWAPVLPTMLALAYHVRVDEAPAAAPAAMLR